MKWLDDHVLRSRPRRQNSVLALMLDDSGYRALSERTSIPFERASSILTFYYLIELFFNSSIENVFLFVL